MIRHATSFRSCDVLVEFMAKLMDSGRTTKHIVIAKCFEACGMMMSHFAVAYMRINESI